MPLLLYTYLATEILAPFLAALLILNAILFLGKLVPLLEGIFSFGIGAADFIRLLAYMAPQLLLFSIPMASMMGVIISFTRLNSENEIIALKTAGVGLYRMLPPVLVVALLTAALTGISSIYFIPHGTVAMKTLLFQLAKEKIDKGMRERQFSESLGNVVLYVDRIDPITARWHGVYISDLRDEKTPITVVAREGSLQARPAEMQISLELLDGSVHRALADLTQTINFKRYTLDLPVIGPETVLGERADGFDKNSMTQQELLTQARALGTGTPQGAGLLVEYYERLVLPVGCFILSLLGLPLALAAGIGRRRLGLPLGLLFFIFYYVLTTAAKGLSESTPLPIGATMWVPNLLFALLTVVLLRNTAREKQYHFLEKLHEMAARFFSRIRGKKGGEHP